MIRHAVVFRALIIYILILLITIINSLNYFLQAQEELAWKIAKMIVSDVMQQAQYDPPPLEKSTKVRVTCVKLKSVLSEGRRD